MIFEMPLGCHPLKTLLKPKYPLQSSVFKASALWADAFCKSKCPSVCPSVCVFTFEVPFKRLFAPTSRSRMSNIFRVSESFGKSNGKKWSQMVTFLVWKWSKITVQKKLVFWLILPYKTWQKPHFPMDQRTLVNDFFMFFKKFGLLGILGPPYCGIGATIRIGREMLYLPYEVFFKRIIFKKYGAHKSCLNFKFTKNKMYITKHLANAFPPRCCTGKETRRLSCSNSVIKV